MAASAEGQSPLDSPIPPLEPSSNNPPIFGSSCDPTPFPASVPPDKRIRSHSCPGWWPVQRGDDTHVGFRCACACHDQEDKWPGWDNYRREQQRDSG